MEDANSPSGHLPHSGYSAFDYSHLIEWMLDPKRKPAHIAFTSGYTRDAAAGTGVGLSVVE